MEYKVKFDTLRQVKLRLIRQTESLLGQVKGRNARGGIEPFLKQYQNGSIT